ncbi:hypothetical protein ACJ72_07873 [Emergomyces africanus]|uniref:Uncharacterized protein n=1 Tax=Emergomyces africanus TaxID=1955775 RepID=A0A1B7NLY4_9EURO|nr:hypothetical protein ACJ72_07873 [Emergomyces africanus]
MATEASPPPSSPTSSSPSPVVTAASSAPSSQSSSGAGAGAGAAAAASPAPLPAPIPPPVPVETHPNRAGLKPPPPRRVLTDPNRLAPQDAFYTNSPPRPRPLVANNHAASLRLPAAVAALRPPPAVPGAEPRRVKEARRRLGSSRRRQKGVWKKLLWVKQSYPDNYTDTETFLDHLQRNPRLRPYDFWPLVADSTVIVQHVCSVVIFVCCFSGIFQERISPVSVVGWGSIGTILGWGLWDFWVGKEQEEAARLSLMGDVAGGDALSTSGSSVSSIKAPNYDSNQKENQTPGLGLQVSTTNLDYQQLRRRSTGLSTLSAHSYSASACSLHSGNSPQSPHSPISPLAPSNLANGSLHFPSDHSSNHYHHPLPSTTNNTTALLSPRNRQRLATAKSALLIFCALLGLSPILKSLTKSTTSDSIWAMSCWLMVINIFFFDYSSNSGGSGTGGSTESGAAAKFPASLSTNAAVMASTVLASRLKSTTHVFSLTLFSIEVFGLFPVFSSPSAGDFLAGSRVADGFASRKC